MHQRSLWFSLTLAFLFLGPSLAGAGNWPRFRGPNGTGISDEKNVPVQWTSADIQWKTAIPGIGHSSPIVWGDRVFLQSASRDARQRWLFCVDVNSGKILWQQGVPGQNQHTHRLNNLSSSTPATDGERVYAIFWNGARLLLAAYDFEGKQLWLRDLGPFTSQHGAGLSPVVYDGLIYINNDQDGSSVVLALDGKTGDEVWRAERKAFRTCYSSPLIHNPGGEQAELIVGSTAGLTSYHPRTGKVNWEFHWEFEGKVLRTVGSPVVESGMVFLTSGDGAGDREMIAVKLGGKGDVSNTHLVWRDRSGTVPYVATFLTHQGLLFSPDAKIRVVTCRQASDGKVLWSQRMRDDMWASPVMANGNMYIASTDGYVYVFEAGPTKKVLAKNPVGEPMSSTPAISNGRILVRGTEHLFCISK
jgi:outer membrane protein assembly factor BamB